MDRRMSDNPLDRIPAYNRVSIRAVLVHEGEDPGPALAAAGIVDPIAIPVVPGEHLDLGGGILGDGITPNLIAVLEAEQHDDFDASPTNQLNLAVSKPGAVRPAEPVATTLPVTFGVGSFAPVGGLGDTRSGRFGDPPTVCPPSPARSLEIDRILTAGWGNPRPYVRFDPPNGTDPSGLHGGSPGGNADGSNALIPTLATSPATSPEPTTPAVTDLPAPATPPATIIPTTQAAASTLSGRPIGVRLQRITQV